MDYEKLGLKAGLEIHQQIDSKHKLFCSCPTEIRDDQPDIVVQRRLRASAGETGEVDVAAKYEQQKQKYFLYQAYNDTVCDVELDEEPIHGLNEEALSVVLQVSAMVKARVVDSIEVMRKTVVDGSNTSGFQRTALVARNGTINTGSGNISIPTICIEEESAKIVSRTGDYDTYNLSRLGIPLIELATGPEIKTPEQIKEVAEYIGMILRSTNKVKRGLGTIRQDVNVSIREGVRVEIKGAQELKLLPKLLELEVLRQVGLVEIRKELKKRKATVDGKIVDITTVMKGSSSRLIRNVIDNKGSILALKLKGFGGLVGKELVPNRRFGRELSDYAKAAAAVGGAVHSDELPNYGITPNEVTKINKKMNCSSKDAFILVADSAKKAELALKVIAERAKQALVGVPQEVRKANPDGTTSFLRPMPGSARMYPETDITAIKPDKKKIEIPELRSNKVERYIKLGLGKDLAAAIIKDEKEELLEAILKKNKKLNVAFVAEILVSYVTELLRLKQGLDPAKIKDTHLMDIFTALNSHKIAKESVKLLLVEISKTGKLDLAKYATFSNQELEKELGKIVAANKEIPFNALIGKTMAQLRGKAEGKKIVDILKKLVR